MRTTNNTAAIDKQKRSMGLKASARISNTIIYIVLIIISMRKKRENQPPAHLGLPYFREER